MNQQNNTPQLRFPEFSGEWEEKKLSEVAEINRGKSKHRPRNAKILYGGKYPFIQTADIREASLYLENFTQTYSEQGLKQSKLWDKDTLCITIAANIAETAILKIKACFPDSIIGLLPNREKSTVLFIKHQFDKFKIDIQRLAQGVAQDNLNLEKLSKLKFKFPTLPEQEKIAAFLSAIDKKIELLTQKKELLTTYKKGVMQQIFPSTGSGNAPKLRFKPENGETYPDWEEKKLREVCTFLRGSALSKSDIIENGKYKCIHYGELFTVYNEVIQEVKSTTDIEGSSLSKCGDVLMPSSDVTPDGLATACCLKLNSVVLGGDINILRPIAVHSEFLSYLLNFSKNAIIRIVTGTTVKHIYNKDVKTLSFTLPNSIEEQTQIAKFLSALDVKINLVNTQLEQTQHFKKGLLQQLFV